MRLQLDRYLKADDYTLGHLYIDGEYFCDTLEDKDRGLADEMTETEITNIKVKGETAIPTGTYQMTLDVVSPKFASRAAYQFCEGKVPRLLGCKCFTGVCIHVGNTATDTAGCILVGEGAVNRVLNSTATFRALYARLLEDKDNLIITIE